MRDLALESVVATRWAGSGNSRRIARDFFPLATERLGLTRCGAVGYFVLVRVCDTICVAVPSRRFRVGTDLLPLPTQRLCLAAGVTVRAFVLVRVRIAIGIAVSGIGRATAELLPSPTGGLGLACGRTMR